MVAGRPLLCFVFVFVVTNKAFALAFDGYLLENISQKGDLDVLRLLYESGPLLRMQGRNKTMVGSTGHVSLVG